MVKDAGFSERNRGKIDPAFHAHAIAKINTRAYRHKIVDAVQGKRLIDEPGCGNGAVAQRTVIAAERIIGIPVPFPPMHGVQRKRHAGGGAHGKRRNRTRAHRAQEKEDDRNE